MGIGNVEGLQQAPAASEEATERFKGDTGLALVVTRSRVNGVVVSRIVERTGIRAELAEPEAAGPKLAALRPATVILDGGPGNEDCIPLYENLTARRRSSTRNLPCVILLSTPPLAPGEIGGGTVVDAIVPKPITPDNLQPTLCRLVAMAKR